MTPETVVRRADRCVTERVGDEAVVWLETDRTLHLLDASATLVWRCLADPTTAAELARHVAELAEADPAVVRDDVFAFLTAMIERSLVVGA